MEPRRHGHLSGCQSVSVPVGAPIGAPAKGPEAWGHVACWSVECKGNLARVIEESPGPSGERKDQATRPISTTRLNTLPCVHLSPINVLVSDGPEVRVNLEVGFALRCFQRLSDPNIATQPCRWRDNWYTRGSSTPVLSYLMQLLSTLIRPRRIGTELSHDVLNPAHVPL